MPGGRKTKKNADVVVRLLEAIKLTCPYEVACAYAGIHYATFRRWMQLGEAAVEKHGRRQKLNEKESGYREFCESVKRAEAEAVVKNLATIELASKDHWQAAAFKLERRYPQHFARRDALQVEASVSLNGLIAEIAKKTASRTATGPEVQVQDDDED